MKIDHPYMNPETLCVGGPCHGKYVSTERPKYLKVLLKSWKRTDVYEKIKSEGPTQIEAMLRTQYKLECVQARLGSLFLEGWVYAWEEMDKGELYRAAMGLMLSECVCHFEVNYDHASRKG